METVDTHTYVRSATENTHKNIVISRDDRHKAQTSLQAPIKNLHSNQQQSQTTQQNLYINRLPTPVKVDRLKPYLSNYDEHKKAYLLNGFTHGFKLEFHGFRGFQYSENLKSALDSSEIVSNKLGKEVETGRIAGPFHDLPLSDLKISPLGLVPKKTPQQFRLIHNLSYPDKKEGSVNAGISDESASVQYSGIGEAITAIKALGTQSFLCKTDVRSAFRICPVHPTDYELLGIKWNGLYYVDRCLPMGCRTSCKIFEEFSSALEWIAIHKLGISSMVHILDDFLIIEQSKESCLSSFKKFVALCEDIGVPLSAEKTVLPSQVIDFVGITLDVQRSEARLPADKLEKCKNSLLKFLQKDKCTLKDMQSLIGLLNFACSVILPGRAFLRRMINLTMTVGQGQKFICISREAKLDMQTWLHFLNGYNGKSLFLDEKFLSSLTMNLFTDAAQSKGFAGIYGSKWFYGCFPDNWKSLNIMTLEFYPIVLAVEIWGSLWQNHSILFFTDNEALVSVINKQTSKDKVVMKMVRCLVLKCLQLNVLFRAKHIPGKKNVQADCLSRLQVEEFRKKAPYAQKDPCFIPDMWQPQNFWKTLIN